MPPIDYNPETETYVRRFQGQLTGDRCREMAGEVEGEINELLEENPGARLVFDLAGVDFIVSAFIRLCLLAARRMPKGNFAIVRCQPEVRKIFSVVGLDKLIELS